MNGFADVYQRLCERFPDEQERGRAFEPLVAKVLRTGMSAGIGATVIARVFAGLAVGGQCIGRAPRGVGGGNKVKQGIDVLICYPRLVQTGLDLIDFPTFCSFETEFSVFQSTQDSTVRMGSGLGQRYEQLSTLASPSQYDRGREGGPHGLTRHDLPQTMHMMQQVGLNGTDMTDLYPSDAPLPTSSVVRCLPQD